jgi:hypothetical protein
VKFRRKAADEPVVQEEVSSELLDAPPVPDEAPAAGPYDVSDVEGDGVERVDLGSLLITPEPGRELRLQVDENTQAVQSVVLAGSDGALELRAFSAPRGGDLWSEVRPQVAADMARRGGTATEREGAFGTELVCQLTVQTPDGKTATQPSRIVGVNGSRWMLRATFLGRPALDAEGAGDWEDSLRSVVVRRGEHAMPVGDALPLSLPANARRQAPPAG